MKGKKLEERLKTQCDNDKSLNPPWPKKNLLIEVTNACNHKCIFCANQKMTRKKGFIKKETVQSVLEQAYELGTREVGFYMTGEPFLCNELPEYIKMAKEIGMEYIYITTNGSLVSEEKMRAVAEAGLNSIKFSINGTDSKNYEFIHGVDDFENVYSNLKKCYELREKNLYQYDIFISHIVTKYTEKELDVFKTKFEKVCDEIVFTNVGNQGGLMPENNIYLSSKEIPIKNCLLPFNAIYVTYEGYLTACCVDFENALVVADLNTSTLKEAWYGEKMLSIRKNIINQSLTNELCSNCFRKQIRKFGFLSPDLTTADIENNIYQNEIVKERVIDYEKKLCNKER